ncbi:GAD-like domain-containing protein [Pseudomonas sp. UBA1879]|uniref:GAD-like domain-containing protein n=1 Tax=Pseudomonas sp. UBA1879 TaxID=1947305 RepID=UPI0025E0B51F|nr:GAD-like domain-containing protein [Pseudomonas sp. UBA1879]
MDEHYKTFTEEFGPGFARREVPDSTLIRYASRLPNQLLKYWEKYGWCGYADGVFWTVNPQEYDEIINAWVTAIPVLANDRLHVIARSAFGDLYIWGEEKGHCLTVSSLTSRYSLRTSKLTGEHSNIGVQSFFSFMQKDHNDFCESFGSLLAKLGRLEADEMYGLIPALALGGSVDLKNFEKIKTIEHLTFLSQLSPLRDWGFPDLDSL